MYFSLPQQERILIHEYDLELLVLKTIQITNSILTDRV